MSTQMVRGYWLTSGVKFLRTRYPAETNERLLGALPKALRAILADIQPVDWYERAYHVEMMKVIVSAHRDEGGAYDSLLAYGQLVAADLSNGALRAVLQILTPKLLAKKLPDLWTSDHRDDGVLETDIAQIDDGCMALRLAELRGYEHVGVVTLGYVKGMLLALGRRDVAVKQTGWSLSLGAPAEMTGEVRWS